MRLDIATANVNGIRAAYRRGMADWLAVTRPHVLTLQEVRAEAEVAQELLGEEWQVVVEPSRIKGRAGVAVAVRADLPAPVAVRTGLVDEDLAEDGKGEPDVDSGRWLEVDLELPEVDDKLTVVSAYLHSGQVNSPKLDQKLAHLPLVSRRLQELAQVATATGQQTVVCGDFNIVHTEADIKNWRGNHNKTSGVLDVEIEFLNEWFGQLGWNDVVRELAGEEQGPYTWWSWRGKAFDNDAGWRIDYHMATPQLTQAAQEFQIGKAASYAARFSDHAPVTVSYQW